MKKCKVPKEYNIYLGYESNFENVLYFTAGCIDSFSVSIGFGKHFLSSLKFKRQVLWTKHGGANMAEHILNSLAAPIEFQYAQNASRVWRYVKFGEDERFAL